MRVAFGGLETAGQTSNAPGGDVVFQDLPPGLYGLGGPVSNGTTIVRGAVILSNNTNFGAGPSYLEGFFTTAVHEVGHALGLQHTWTGSAMSQDVLRNTSRAKPFDFDDVAAINELYGGTGWQNNFGTITGTVRFANGTPVMMASVVAVSPTTGAAVSSLSNPDGTYRIDGIPAGNYQLYVHPLPPDAATADGYGLVLPRDQNGAPFQPNGYFGTVFYPNTTDPQQATTFQIFQGNVLANQNFTVQPRTTVPAYDMYTLSYLERYSRTPLWSLAGRDYNTVSPAFENNTQGGMFLEVRTSAGDAPVPLSATVLGWLGTATSACQSYDCLLVRNDPAGRALWLYFAMPVFAGTGPRHLVLNYGNDIYVLPQAINLVKRPAPGVTSVRSNADGSVTVTGTNFGGDSVVYFDGIQALRSAGFSGNDVQGSLTVVPPPGIGGQTSQILVYNGDGQNSTFLGSWDAPQTYSYNGSDAPQLQKISLSSLPAGATGYVDLASVNTAFVDGQVTIGFGNDDITVTRVWVLDATHLRANLSVSANAVSGFSEVSVISGFQVLSQPNAFQVQPRNPSLPVINVVANANNSQQTIYPGVFATIYGVNLANSTSSVQVTLNDQPMTLQLGGVFSGQINFFIPAGFPTGSAILKLTNGGVAANPIAMQIDAAPPSILSVTNASGVPYDAGHPAFSQDVVTVRVTGLDPNVLANPSRLQITINGQPMPVQSVTSVGNGQAQITFVMTQGFGGVLVNLAVVVDGSESVAFPITVR
jgi:uncharacterized protein (TIGR03437 family)